MIIHSLFSPQDFSHEYPRVVSLLMTRVFLAAHIHNWPLVWTHHRSGQKRLTRFWFKPRGASQLPSGGPSAHLRRRAALFTSPATVASRIGCYNHTRFSKTTSSMKGSVKINKSAFRLSCFLVTAKTSTTFPPREQRTCGLFALNATETEGTARVATFAVPLIATWGLLQRWVGLHGPQC